MDNQEKDFYTSDNFYTDTTSTQPQESVDINDSQAQIEDLSKKCMIFGIVAVAIAWVCGCLFVASVILSILSLRNLSKAKKLNGTAKMNGQMIAGMVCSIIALCLSALYLLMIVFYVFFFLMAFLVGMGTSGAGVTF